MMPARRGRAGPSHRRLEPRVKAGASRGRSGFHSPAGRGTLRPMEPLRVMLWTPPRGLARRRPVPPRFTVPSLGLGSLATYLRQKAGFPVEVFIFDAYSFPMEEDRIREAITYFRPHVLGVSTVTVLAPDADRICELAKEVDPDVVTIAGGVHATALPEETASHPAVDGCVVGDGEETFLELCRALHGGGNPDEVAGLCLKGPDGKVRFTGERTPIRDLDSLPAVDMELFPDIRRYRPVSHWGRGDRLTAMVTSRGCPYRCPFCSLSAAQGTRYRARSPDLIVKEMVYLREQYGVEAIGFRDSSLTTDRERIMYLCHLLEKVRPAIRWTCNARPDQVDEEILGIMKAAGCTAIFFGIENGNDELLWRYKRLRKASVVQTTRAARKLGLEAQVYFLLGMPEEDRSTIGETIRFACSLPFTAASFHIATPLPDSELYRHCVANDLLLTRSWDRFDPARTPVWRHPRLGGGELVRLRKRAYRRFYLRPGAAWGRVRPIRTLRGAIRVLKLARTFLR